MSSENVDDRLSRLPEDITSQILSLMPMKFAVQTCILSKSWRYSWMLVTDLDFDDDHVPSILINNLTDIVDQVLEFRKSSQVKIFRLHITNIVVPKSSVSKWIDKAVNLKVCEFDIQIMNLDLPLSFFTCKTLTKLRLHRTTGDCSCWEFPCSVSLPCLKTLDIVVYSNPFVNAFRLINGCPILETLSFEGHLLWGIYEDYIFNIPTLKRLRLTIRYAMLVSRVVLDVPNLEYLFVGARLSVYLMKDVSSLVEASISVSYLSFDYLLAELLEGLSGVKSLSVQTNCFAYFGDSLYVGPPIFTNMIHIEFKGFPYSSLIPQFLERSPHLKHLSIESIEDQAEEFTWLELWVVPACMITTLSTIRFLNCKGLECDIQLLEYMLENSKVLKTVTITWENLSIEEETRLRTQLLKVPRASPYCEISVY